MEHLASDILHYGGFRQFSKSIPYEKSYADLIAALDRREGAMLLCNVNSDVYRRQIVGFVDPPLRLDIEADRITVCTNGPIGEYVYVRCITPALDRLEAANPGDSRQALRQFFSEISTPDLLGDDVDSLLGYYGALGFDLALFELDVPMEKARSPGQRDVVLFFPDEFQIFDPDTRIAKNISYCVDRHIGGADFYAAPRKHVRQIAALQRRKTCEGERGQLSLDTYEDLVDTVKDHIGRGDCFEIVVSKIHQTPLSEPVSQIFQRICDKRPAPYSFFLNLGEDEYLLGTSPEMLLRIQDGTVEARPIAGSAKRGETASQDEANTRELLNSKKNMAELMMCCDVVRNDLMKVCEPKTVELRANRQIEMYSNVIHTVDYLTGQLRSNKTPIDALFDHMWSVALTGAPKAKAIELIERYESEPRRWYGGAVGYIRLDGSLDLGIPIAMMHITSGIGRIQAGSSITWDSKASDESAEAKNKISFFTTEDRDDSRVRSCSASVKLLFVDFDDSFTHITAGMLSEMVERVEVVNFRDAIHYLRADDWGAVVLSAGPGHPTEYPIDEILDQCVLGSIPTLGICLGMQAIVGYFGGRIGQLAVPVHGKSSEIRLSDESILYRNLPMTVEAGRYHSLYADHHDLPDRLKVTSVSADGIVMSVEDKYVPILGVQYHPESIMSEAFGRTLLANFVQVAMETEGAWQ